MAIPNTNTFSLAQVRIELNLPSNSNLIACFSAAVSGNFNPAYSGLKNSLLNFRDYKAPSSDPLAVAPPVISIGNGNPSESLFIQTAGTWTAVATEGSSWINLPTPSGSGNSSIVVNYLGVSNQNRTGNIRIQNSGGTVVNVLVNEQN